MCYSQQNTRIWFYVILQEYLIFRCRVYICTKVHERALVFVVRL